MNISVINNIFKKVSYILLFAIFCLSSVYSMGRDSMGQKAWELDGRYIDLALACECVSTPVVTQVLRMPIQVEIINDTDKNYFIITSFRSYNVYAGYLIASGSSKVIDRIYIGRFDVDNYTHPDYIYIYDNYLSVSREIECRKLRSAEFINYLTKIKIHKQVDDRAVIYLSKHLR